MKQAIACADEMGIGYDVEKGGESVTIFGDKNRLWEFLDAFGFNHRVSRPRFAGCPVNYTKKGETEHERNRYVAFIPNSSRSRQHSATIWVYYSVYGCCSVLWCSFVW